MKKLFLFTICFSMIFGKLIAQDKAEAQKFRFGLKMAPSIAWMKPDDKKKLLSDGSLLKFAYGLVAEFRLTSVASFSTGLEVNYTGGRLNFANAADSAFYDPSEYTLPVTGSFDRYLIAQRSYKITYVDIPLLLKMRTPEVGAFTYFGMFGLNLSIRGKVKANDIGTLVNYKDTIITVVNDYEIPDLIVTKDMSFFRAGLNVGAGAEYRIAGTTALFASLNFQNGFTNVLKKESETIKSLAKKGQALQQNAKSNFFQLNIGILF